MTVAVKKCKKEIPLEAASPESQPLSGIGRSASKPGRRYVQVLAVMNQAHYNRK